MRRIPSNWANPIVAIVSLLIITTVPALLSPAAAQTPEPAPPAAAERPDTAASPADTTTAPDAGGTGGRVRISIDESGISIEGDARVKSQASTEDEDWVEVYDNRSRLKEKGLDIVKFGESVFVADDELVRGDLVVFGGNAMIEGKVVGNVVVIGGNIRARSGAEVKGDAVVIGGELEEDEDVIIHGERVVIHSFVPSGEWWEWLGLRGGWFEFFVLPVTIFIKLVLAFLILMFIRERIVAGHGHLADNFFKAFGVGLLSTFAGFFGILILVVILCITIIGIPLAILLIISCAGVFVLAWTVFAFSFGGFVAKRLGIVSDSPFLMVFIGALAIHLPEIIATGIGVIPGTWLAPLGWLFLVLSWLIKLVAYMGGLGALVLSRFGSRSIAPYTPSPPAPGPETAPAR